jgi:hypothetical protein
MFCNALFPPPLLPPGQLPSKHSVIHPPRPPTNHPFAQTTQLLCPAQLPWIMAASPPSLITTLAPPGQGQGGTDLCLCLELLGPGGLFPSGHQGQEQIRDPQLGSLQSVPPTPPPGPWAQAAGVGQEVRMLETPICAQRIEEALRSGLRKQQTQALPFRCSVRKCSAETALQDGRWG